MVNTIKFSNMLPGGDLTTTSATPGLAPANQNVLFTNPAPNLAPGPTASRPDPLLDTTVINRLRFNTDLQAWEYYSSAAVNWVQLSLSWNAYTVDTAITPFKGYITNGALQLVLSLPLTSNVGELFSVQGLAATGWKIVANAGQTIHIGSTSSSTGGSVASLGQYDSAQFVCIVANLQWAAIGMPMSAGLLIL